MTDIKRPGTTSEWNGFAKGQQKEGLTESIGKERTDARCMGSTSFVRPIGNYIRTDQR